MRFSFPTFSCFQQRAPYVADVPLLKHWSWSFEPFYWILLHDSTLFVIDIHQNMPISLILTPFYHFHFHQTWCSQFASASAAVFVQLNQNKTNTEAAILSKNLSHAGKPCSGQICQQAYQPPRKVPGFSKLLELLNISIFVCLKFCIFLLKFLHLCIILGSRTLAHCSTQVSLSARNMLGRPLPGWTRYLWNWSKVYWLIPIRQNKTNN